MTLNLHPSSWKKIVFTAEEKTSLCVSQLGSNRTLISVPLSFIFKIPIFLNVGSIWRHFPANISSWCLLRPLPSSPVMSMRNPPQRRRSLGPVSPKRIYRNLSVRLRGGESSVSEEVDVPKRPSKPAEAVRCVLMLFLGEGLVWQLHLTSNIFIVPPFCTWLLHLRNNLLYSWCTTYLSLVQFDYKFGVKSKHWENL